MKLPNIVRESLFREIAAAYAKHSGLPLVLADLSGRELYRANFEDDACIRLGISRGIEPRFREWRRKAVFESNRWGEAYFSESPLGLICFSVPVLRRGALLGAFISGFAVFPEMEQDIAEDIAGRIKSLGLAARRSVKRIKFKVVTKTGIKRQADRLLRLSREYGLSDPGMLDEKKEKSAQQLTIAGFLEHFKLEKIDTAKMIIDKQHEIIQRIRMGDRKGAREILNEYLGSIFLDSGMKFEVLKIRLIELLTMMSRFAIESGASSRELLDLNYRCFTELIGEEGFDDLCLKVTRMLESFMTKVTASASRRRNVEIQRMRDFVNRNFTSHIRARDVARAAELSVSRALHLFREGTGFSLTGYIKKMRVEYGKYLLLNTDKNIIEIANETGFFDQSHFTKNFTRLERMTPREFRRRSADFTADTDASDQDIRTSHCDPV